VFVHSRRRCVHVVGSVPAAGQNVGSIATTYDDLGRVQTVTSYQPSETTVVNQVEYAYDGWGNEICEWQAQTGAVDTSGTPSVQYTYDDGAGTSGAAQYLRLSDVIYPNGREVQYDYGNEVSPPSFAQAVDNIMSRVESINTVGETTPNAEYTYLGAGAIASETYPQPEVSLNYDPSGDGSFTGFDQFGDVVDQIWSGYGANNSGTLDGCSYTYDAAGNRTSKANLTDAALSELYGYDDLDRLTSWSVNGTQQETWTLDSLGNNLAAGSYDAANQEKPTAGSSGYDAAGNMTTLLSGDKAVYDAWDRLVGVDDSSGNPIEKYSYDGTNRRIQIYSDFSGGTPGTVTDDYLSGQQVIESDVTSGGSRAGGYQYLWSPRYIDAPILRDTLNTAGTGIVAAQRVFYLGDADYNVTALVSAGGSVLERYAYTPYGAVTVRAADWTPINPNVSQVGNIILYTGQEYSFATGLYCYRKRYYDPALGRFIGEDPMGVTAGLNLYGYCGDAPVRHTDPRGTDPSALSTAKSLEVDAADVVERLVSHPSAGPFSLRYSLQANVGDPLLGLFGGCGRFTQPWWAGGGEIRGGGTSQWIVSGIYGAGEWVCNKVDSGNDSGNGWESAANEGGALHLLVWGSCPGKYAVDVDYAVVLITNDTGTASANFHVFGDGSAATSRSFASGPPLQATVSSELLSARAYVTIKWPWRRRTTLFDRIVPFLYTPVINIGEEAPADAYTVAAAGIRVKKIEKVG
jgi:RHS repeat-associated protein